MLQHREYYNDDDNAKSKRKMGRPRMVAVCLLSFFIGIVVLQFALPTPKRRGGNAPPWLTSPPPTLPREVPLPPDALPRASVESPVEQRPSVAPGGQQCTPQQAAKQGRYVEAAKVRGCPGKDDLWMRMVHLVMPQARTFIDIGSNKGFTAARFYELWNPELGIDARVVHDAHRRLSPSSKELTECGACSDCTDVSHPFAARSTLLCSSEASSSSDPNSRVGLAVEELCKERATVFNPIRVLSFDGNPDMVNGVQSAIHHLSSSLGQSSLLQGVPKSRLPPKPGSKLATRWTVQHAAFIDTYEKGKTVTFTLGLGELGHVGEADRARIKTFEPTRKVEVPVLTVDAMVTSYGLPQIDVLKIDTEGFDPMVLKGAQDTLSRGGATVVIFEYHKYWDTTLESVTRNLEQHGYACYLEGKNALLKLTHGCWSGELELKKWSNVWCALTRHPSGAALATIFDGYTLAFV